MNGTPYNRDGARTRSALLGPSAWPVAVPEDVDDSRLVKASGEVELPHHIRWSGPPLSYDLDNAIGRARVYEQVLREGTDDDVRFYVRVDELLALWDRLMLSPQVRLAWVRWFRRHHRQRAGGRQVLAVFGRAEARDFVDLMAVEHEYGLDVLFDLAREKDRGFLPSVFAEMVSRFERLRREEFDIDTPGYERLRRAVAAWREKAIGLSSERGLDVNRGQDDDLGMGL